MFIVPLYTISTISNGQTWLTTVVIVSLWCVRIRDLSGTVQHIHFYPQAAIVTLLIFRGASSESGRAKYCFQITWVADVLLTCAAPSAYPHTGRYWMFTCMLQQCWPDSIPRFAPLYKSERRSGPFLILLDTWVGDLRMVGHVAHPPSTNPTSLYENKNN